MQNLLEGLNDEQLAAVTHKEGPLMIVAGAGTGKTTVVTQRIAWLIEQRHTAPENILALTFTDKAAAEMEERVDLLLPIGYVDLQISTFHAFAERMLREYGAEIGLARDFTLLDELDSWLLTRQNFDRFDLDYYRPLGNPTKYLRGLLAHFSRAKDAAISADEYLAFAEEKAADADRMSSDELDEQKRLKELAGAYHTYSQILLENDALDFGDLMLYLLKLLKERPKILAELRERFTYVLVDEFQDTNHAQYEIVKLLAAPKNNITIVGDDDQSIYRFRGASIENILAFQDDYPDAKKIVLTQNYRSTQEILDLAHTFIQANNPNRLEAREDAGINKRLKANTEAQGVIDHLHESALEDEAERVAERVVALKEADPELGWNDVAILVRSNDAADPFVEALERRGVPFQFLALRGLYVKRPVLDMIALLRVVDNPYESPSLYRVLTSPVLKISAPEIAAINHYAMRKGKSVYEALNDAAIIGISSEALESVDGFLHRRREWAHAAKTKRASELLLTVAKESGYVQYVNGLGEREKQEQFQFLQQLFQRVKKFEGRHENPVLHHFLEEFDRERAGGEEGALAPDMEFGPDMVRIMTVHASKGLEFRHVFIVNLVDRRFPTQARREAIPLPEALVEPSHKEAHLEEERRLFYVALTRAKESVYFTSAEDYGGARKKKLSRFLTELDREAPEVPEERTRNVFTDPVPASPTADTDLVFELPKAFSFTQLAAFRTCPLQYKFAHVYKIPVFGRWTLSYGKTMHNTLHRYFLTWMERVGSSQASLFDALAATDGVPVSKDELMQLYEDYWIDEWYINDTQREKYRAQGKASLIDYFSKIEKKIPEPLYLEQGFTLKIGGAVLKGRIDRIDKCEDGVEIIDYKTGSAKTKLDADEKEQLLLYQLAARDVLGLEVKKLTFHYLEDNSTLSFVGTPEDLVSLEEKILSRVAGIKESQFEPTPGRHCNYCDFKDICEFRSK